MALGWSLMLHCRVKEAIAFAKPYNPDAFLAVGAYTRFPSREPN